MIDDKKDACEVRQAMAAEVARMPSGNPGTIALKVLATTQAHELPPAEEVGVLGYFLAVAHEVTGKVADGDAYHVANRLALEGEAARMLIEADEAEAERLLREADALEAFGKHRFNPH